MSNYEPWWYWKSLKRYSGTIVPVNMNGKTEWIKYTPEYIQYLCSLKDVRYIDTKPIIVDAYDFID